MGQLVYRGNILPAGFPFLSEQFGRTVIVGRTDQLSSKALGDGEADRLANAGAPQLYYCHNIAPNDHGLQSIDYSTLVAQQAQGETRFNRIISLRDSLDRTAYLGIMNDGSVFITKPPFSSWTHKGNLGAGLTTRAYVQGTTYIYVANIGCYRFDFASDSFVGVSLGGLNPAAVIGIMSFAGYLIAWTSDTIAWSSIANPTDFVPSLSTGAGAASVEGAAGAILIVAATHAGILVYTTGNVVAASYTGNSQYPFTFRSLPASGGLKDVNHVDYDSLSGQQFAYTTSGMQQFDIQQSKAVFPEITDFISGGRIEDCDVNSGTFTVTDLNSAMLKSVRLVANRYIIVSYGVTSLTHAILFDTQLKRFGKLRINHVACVDLVLGVSAVDIPRNSIGFLQADGTVKVVNFDSNVVATDSVALLGKYQLMRERMLQLDSVEFENVGSTSNLVVRDFVSIDGKNSSPTILQSAVASGFYRKYNCRLTGKNHSLMLTGSMFLNTIVLTFNIHGKR